MTQANHTPELKPCPWCKAEGEHRLFHNDEGIDDAVHANACVNALRGLNPEAMKNLVEACDALIEDAPSVVSERLMRIITALAAVKEVQADANAR